MISYTSAVLVTGHFDLMTRFYENVLEQRVKYDFGGCVQFESGLSIWRVQEGHPVSRALKGVGGSNNAALELCFETDDFDAQAARITAMGVMLAHGVIEENWGQRTLRFFDPDGNLVEVGESMPAFCMRLHMSGMSVEEVGKKTGIEQNIVKHFLGS
jgi:catechol 2,3-dioxygenase-like lactoylglutathione lyase family enzyme